VATRMRITGDERLAWETKNRGGDSVGHAELSTHGLLKPSFTPPRPQRELRDWARYRTRLVQERAPVVNRLQMPS
jgi:hypothetical protein